MSVSIIIPSRNHANLQACVASIRASGQWEQIIVVDDGLKSREIRGAGHLMFLDGIKPFIFSRACNQGIKAARSRIDVTTHSSGEPVFVDGPAEDVILLNDDAMLETHGGFTALAQCAAEHPEYGIVASTCNNVGNPNQHQRAVGLRYEPRMVCFVCVFIPRATLNTVGLLDEDYTTYGSEDDDYCYRVRKAGLRIGIFDGCFVNHARLHSSFRGDHGCDIAAGIEIFRRKHGGYPL